MTRYDQWKTATPPDAVEYDYDRYNGLPYRFDEGLGRWRDKENGQIVADFVAIEANDSECERQEQNKVDRENEFWRGEA